MFRQITEVMHFVPNRREAADWCSQLFETDLLFLDDNPDYFYLQVGWQQLWFHEADDQSPSSTGGQVAYWKVEDLDTTLQKALELGAELYRGPLDRSDGFWMCQVKAPFGGVIGLIGPRNKRDEETPQANTTVILIGPVGVGKSTLGRLLAAKLGVPQRPMDRHRWSYYNEIGYENELADRLYKEKGFVGVYRYWKPFEAYAVWRLLSDYSDCVIDMGGGHTVYEDDALFARIQKILEPYPNVILLLPTPDLDESVRILRERAGDEVSTDLDFHEHFVKHHSNHDLAKIVVYTEGKTPEESCEEISALLTQRRTAPHRAT
jgi:shikimate kinase